MSDHIWITGYTTSDQDQSVLARGLFFRAIHDSEDEANRYVENIRSHSVVNEYILAKDVEAQVAAITKENGILRVGLDQRWADFKAQADLAAVLQTENARLRNELEEIRWIPQDIDYATDIDRLIAMRVRCDKALAHTSLKEKP